MKTQKTLIYLGLLTSLILTSWALQNPEPQTPPSSLPAPAPESIPAPASPGEQQPKPEVPAELQSQPAAPTPAPTASHAPPITMPNQTPPHMTTPPQATAPSPAPGQLPSPIPAPGTSMKDTHAPLHVQSQPSSQHTAEALVLSCSDFRLNDDVARILEKEGLKEKYDLLVIPGGTLSATNDFFPSWRETFWSGTGILKNLHHFKKVILIDHRDCGAYKMVYGRDLSTNPEEEKKIHMTHSKKLKRQIKKKYPDLKVDIWLVALDGSYEKTDIDK